MNTGMIHCRLYSPVGMIPVTALQKTRNVPVCPPSKLSSSLLNQVFHYISRYLLGVPKPWILLWFFFFLPPLHQLICQFMQISLQQTFFFFPTSNVWSTCGYKGPDPLLQLKGHPMFRSSSGLAQFSAATAFQFNFSLCLILTFSQPKRCFWEHSSTNFLHNHLRVSIYFLGNSIYDVSFPCPLLHPGLYPIISCLEYCECIIIGSSPHWLPIYTQSIQLLTNYLSQSIAQIMLFSCSKTLVLPNPFYYPSCDLPDLS